MLAAQAVHTVGVNWESVSVIVASVVAAVGAVAAYIRRSVKGSIDNLAQVLTERLETKTTVAALTTRVAVLEVERRARRGGS